jgi:hypothetical protein
LLFCNSLLQTDFQWSSVRCNCSSAYMKRKIFSIRYTTGLVTLFTEASKFTVYIALSTSLPTKLNGDTWQWQHVSEFKVMYAPLTSHMCTILPTKYQLTTDPPYALTDKQTASCTLLQSVSFESKHGRYNTRSCNLQRGTWVPTPIPIVNIPSFPHQTSSLTESNLCIRTQTATSPVRWRTIWWPS